MSKIQNFCRPKIFVIKFQQFVFCEPKIRKKQIFNIEDYLVVYYIKTVMNYLTFKLTIEMLHK